MWPFATREASPLASIPVRSPKFEYSEFEVNSKEVGVNFASTMWSQITNIAYANRCSMNSAVLGLLFQEMYGRCAYDELLKYADQLRAQRQREDELFKSASSLPDIRKSRDRTTSIDQKYLGKPDTPRTIVMPIKMHADLNRHASKQPGSPSVAVYVREVMFKLLNGSVLHEHWRNERLLMHSSRGV